MENYTPERMAHAISLTLPSQRTTEESPLARKHTHSLDRKRHTLTRSTSSSSSASSSSDDESEHGTKLPNERTPTLSQLQTPKARQGSHIYASPAGPIASPSPMKNGNYEVQADFLQAMMIVLEREANMSRSNAHAPTKGEVKKIVRKELSKIGEGKPDHHANNPSSSAPPTDERETKKGKEESEDERKARSAVHAAFSTASTSHTTNHNPVVRSSRSTDVLIREIVRDELNLQSQPRAYVNKQPHEYLSPSAILRASITIAGLEVIRRIFERRPEEAKWIFGGAGKVGTYVFGGFLAAKGLLWGVEQWWAGRDEEETHFRGEYGAVGGDDIAVVEA